uniref:Uncharacterized protein n=1 Tax=Arundo donax TaxID=35708 RepID=A0A0A9A862_ARUDO
MLSCLYCVRVRITMAVKMRIMGLPHSVFSTWPQIPSLQRCENALCYKMLESKLLG